MKSKLEKICLFCLVLILSQVSLLFAAKNPSTPSILSKATKIMDIQLEQKDKTLKLIIKGNGHMKPRVYSWSNMIVVDIPDVKFNNEIPVKMVSPVKEVRVGKHKEKTRLVFQLEEMKKFDVSSRQNTVIITLKHIAPASKSAGPRITVGQKETLQEQKESESIEKRKSKPVEIETSTIAVKKSKGYEARLGEAYTDKKVSTDSIAFKNTASHIPIERQEVLRDQQKPEIIEKKEIKPVNTNISVAEGAVKESKGAKIKGEESNTSKEISSDSSGKEKEYVIGVEDVLDIQVWNNDDLHRTVEVSQEGAFTFPLIGKVMASGLSVFELEKHLKDRLAGGGFLVDPQMTVSVTKYESQKIILLGEVKRPGSYTIKGKTHILEIISAAGGLTEMASHTIAILRPGSGKKANPKTSKECIMIEADLDRMTEESSDERFFVVAGDSVFVSKAPPIFVTGEITKPGEYRWEKGLTVHQAISAAGGPTKRGAINRTKIIRNENGEEREFRPALSDVILPNDIIKVPESYF
jgi:polysaccharide export outer membrane protein